MTGYVSQVLQKYQQPKQKSTQHAPHKCMEYNYGAKV